MFEKTLQQLEIKVGERMGECRHTLLQLRPPAHQSECPFWKAGPPVWCRKWASLHNDSLDPRGQWGYVHFVQSHPDKWTRVQITEITHSPVLVNIYVSTYSEFWLFKVMKRQRLEVMCPRVVLHYRQLARIKMQNHGSMTTSSNSCNVSKSVRAQLRP